MRVSLNQRLFFSFGLILLLVGVQLLFGLWASGARGRALERTTQRIEAQLMLAEIEHALGERRREGLSIHSVVSTGNQDLVPPERIAQIGQRFEKLKQDVYRFGDTLLPEDRAMFHELRAGVESSQAAWRRIAAGRGSPQTFRDSMNRAARQGVELQTRVQDRVQTALADIQRIERQTTTRSLILFIGSLVLAFVVSLWFSRYLRRGLTDLREGANRFGKGDMNHRIPVGKDDVLAELAEAFNLMATTRQTALLKLDAARADAERANVAKTSFFANMSHELRTPMNAIIGYSEMLLEIAEEDELDDYADDLGKIRSSGKHLLELINDVLDLAKIESGKMQLNVQSVDLTKLVEELVTTSAPLLSENHNRLETHLDDRLGRIDTDQTKLRQVLLNLMSNACKFTQENLIQLVTEAHERDGKTWVHITVEDRGIGMTPQQMERIFDEFAQAEVSTSDQFGGTGLGLPISQKICELMGGRITVRSEPGQGSAFIVELPVDHVSSSVDASGATGSSASSAAGPMPGSQATGQTILVIDDDPSVRELTTRILTRAGYRVATAASGKAGLEAASQLQPDLITLDIIMPGLDGGSVLASLKADPATQDIPVMLVSMLDEEHVNTQQGVAAYMTKPVDRDRLVQTIQQIKGSAARPGRVLVVEDDPAARAVIDSAMSAEGWTVEPARDGEEGLSQFHLATPDLVILDLMLPGIDGFTFLARIRAQAEGCRVPVIVVTAKDLTEAERNTLSQYSTVVIQKNGQTNDELLRQVRQLMGGKPQTHTPDA